MRHIGPVFKREFLGYFRSPVAYVFLIAFLVISIAWSFSKFAAGGIFKAGIASMDRYFEAFPWLFLFLVPAVGMRLWSEEKRSGTVELLFTLPVTTVEAVFAKFFAGWAFLSLAVLLSFPLAITIGYLGNPDWGVVTASYIGAILMAGAYLGICALMSALTKNQVIAFVLSIGVCVIFVFLGYSGFSETLESVFPVGVADAVANFSFGTHFNAFLMGVIDLKDVVFFLSLIGLTMFLNVVALER